MTDAERSEREWFTVAEVAERLHVEHITAWRLVRPHRARCHLARNGPHPRLLLWVPATVLQELEGGRPWR